MIKTMNKNDDKNDDTAKNKLMKQNKIKEVNRPLHMKFELPCGSTQKIIQSGLSLIITSHTENLDYFLLLIR